MSAPTPADDGGFTLIEVLVVLALLAITGAIITNLMVTGLKEQTQISDRITSVNDLRRVMERITRDVRNADVVDAATDGSLTFDVRTGSTTHHFLYALRTLSSGRALVLDEDTLPTQVVLSDVPASVSVLFAYQPYPGFEPGSSGVSKEDCSTASGPVPYSPTCIGRVTVMLHTQIQHGTAVIDLTDVVRLRNVNAP